MSGFTKVFSILCLLIVVMLTALFTDHEKIAEDMLMYIVLTLTGYGMFLAASYLLDQV